MLLIFGARPLLSFDFRAAVNIGPHFWAFPSRGTRLGEMGGWPYARRWTRSDYWVDAAPFRAQLHHLMGSTALSLGEVAAAAGISVRLAEHLAYGRNGRALRRVSPDTARRLMTLSVAQLRRRGAAAGRPARRGRLRGMTTAIGGGMAVVAGAVVASVLLGRLVVARLPEPADGAGKVRYADLVSTGFVVGCALVSGAAAVIGWLAVPTALQPLWWVLATFGVVLAAVDARTTWLPLRLTRLAWAAMAAAGLLALLLGAGWLALLRAGAGAGAGRSALPGRLAALRRRVRLRRRALRPARRRRHGRRLLVAAGHRAVRRQRAGRGVRRAPAGPPARRALPLRPGHAGRRLPRLRHRRRSAEPTRWPRGRTARRGRTRRRRPAPARCGRPGPAR